MSRGLARLVAGALVALAAGSGLLAGTGPAQAATCEAADGVSVVVDFGDLGGGVQTACDAGGGGRKAATLFVESGFPLAYVQRQPGFVCRVSGVPADDPCVNTPPTDAYWGLFWSDGTDGKWSYASLSVGSLKVPDGGYVAFAWQAGGGRRLPGVAPTAHGSPTSSPTSPSSSPTRQHTGQPTRTPTTRPSNGPSNGPSTDPSSPLTGSTAPTTGGPTSSAATTRSPSASEPAPAGTGDGGQPSSGETAGAAAPTPANPDSGPAGVPTLLVVGLIGLLVLGAGLATYLRRSG